MMGLMILNSMMVSPSRELQKVEKLENPKIARKYDNNEILSTWLGSVYKPSVLDGQNISRALLLWIMATILMA